MGGSKFIQHEVTGIGERICMSTKQDKINDMKFSDILNQQRIHRCGGLNQHANKISHYFPFSVVIKKHGLN